jgi:hypothetical protein
MTVHTPISNWAYCGRVITVSGAKSFARWFLVLTLLLSIALLRAERGVAEMQGRQGEPSRMFRLVPQPNGDWTVTVIGLDRRIPAQRLMFTARSYAERISKALP